MIIAPLPAKRPVANCNSFRWRAKSFGGSTSPCTVASPAKGLEGFALAQLTDISHQGMDGAFVQGMSPGRHAGSPAHGKSAELDGFKKLFIGPGFQVFAFGVITGWNREELGVDAVSLAFNAMALGAVPLISFPGIFCNSHRFLLRSLWADFLDLLL